MKELLGLTDAEASALQKDLLAAKQSYTKARINYEQCLQNGDKDAAAQAKAEMTKFHDVAESVRNTYGYTGDVEGASDGGFFTGGNSSMPNAIPGGAPAQGGSVTPGGGVTPGGADEFIVDPTKVVRTYNITVSCGAGGTANPTGKVVVKQGNDQTITFAPNEGYEISAVMVDGVNKGSISSYTFTDVREAHSISAAFRANGTVKLGSASITDKDGLDLSKNNNKIKSGYGVYISVPVTASGVDDISVTASYNFGNGGRGSVTLENAGAAYVCPENPESKTGARCIYIPVETKDGKHSLTITVTAKDKEGNTVSDSVTKNITVKGSMYEDDFSGR